MKKSVFSLFILALVFSVAGSEAKAEIDWIEGYSRKDGTYVSGHYRDTSNDGNPYNNANYLGYND